VGQRWCKPCLKEASGAALIRRRLRAKQHLLDHLLKHPCVDCGEADPVVLEFDHLRAKTGTLTQLAHDGVTLARLDEEIAKCEVVCAACHRRRTCARRPAYVFTDPICERNVRYVKTALEGGECVDCGTADIAVLEFDHVGIKTGSVMALAWSGRSLARIELEMTQCEIRCVNCHRRRTAQDRGHYRYVALNPPL
jgi:hypothetical protein